MIYTGEHLQEISFPLGGIGTGCIGLAGNGNLTDFEIFNRPNKGGYAGYTFFAVRAEKPGGETDLRILQGDLTTHLTGPYRKSPFGGFGFGPDRNTVSSLPHFREVEFKGEFPIAEITFRDPAFPAEVVMTAFNPFIPLDADNSGLPAAFFSIRIRGHEDGVKYTLVMTAQNPFAVTRNKEFHENGLHGVTLTYDGIDRTDLRYGDITVATDAPGATVQEYWFRDRWIWTRMGVFWDELTAGELTGRHYDTAAEYDVCSIAAERVVGRDETADFRFLYAWNVPNNHNYADPYLDENGDPITWKNYYAVLHEDSRATAEYAFTHWDSLYARTDRFRRSLHGSTLDPAVIDAVSSTLSVLKSPTVLRLEDGTFYGWEGVYETGGSCEGTCTHVWSYAYALCFLFPDLERSIREAEFTYDTDEHGLQCFRTRLPLGRERLNAFPCVDGQMASVFKTYREWKISGDTAWLRRHWDKVKSLLEFAWSEHNPFRWDRNKDGVLEGRQHHTLDMELFSPSSWLESMYLTALLAAAEMAEAMGEPDKQREYRELFEKGYVFMRNELFNGEYFIQRLELHDRTPADLFDCPDYWNEERQELNYQIGEGCEIDQMLGQWHARLCGLEDIFDPGQRQTALRAVMRNNFKSPLRDFANNWRIFALNDEAGTVMCTYPAGAVKPAVPIMYAGECMTGFEYAFAGLLISEGMIEEGLTVVRSIRDRYDGKKRNPYNEIECGSNYARAMASFALLPIFSGFEYDMPRHRIGFSPILPIGGGEFRCLWSLQPGWGEYVQTEDHAAIVIREGELTLTQIRLGKVSQVRSVTADGADIPFEWADHVVTIPPTVVRKELRFEVSV